MHRYHQVHDIVFIESFEYFFLKKSSIGINPDKHSFFFQVVHKFPKKWCHKWFSSSKDYISGSSVMEFIHNSCIVIKSESLSRISPFEWIVIIIETVVTKKITFTGNSQYYSKWYFVIEFFILEKMEISGISFCKYLYEFNHEVLVISSYVPIFRALTPTLSQWERGKRRKISMLKVYIGFIIFVT